MPTPPSTTKGFLRVTLTIAPPPDLQLATKSSAFVVPAPGATYKHAITGTTPLDGPEEVMDYSPIVLGELDAPDFPADAVDLEGNGPLGY